MLSLDHNHIVKAYDKKVNISMRVTDYAYMVLEYCKGGDLFTLLRKQYNISDVLNKFVYGIGSALQYIHSQGIIHHDLKPENIFVTTGPDNLEILKLGDFGLYSKVDESYKPVTKGTELYLPLYQLISNNIARKSAIYYHKNSINFTDTNDDYVPVAKYFIDWYAYVCIIYYIITKESFNIINDIQAIIFNTCCINLNLIQDTILCNILINIMCIDIQVYFTGVDDLSNKYYKSLFDLIENKNKIHIAPQISKLKTKQNYNLSYNNTKKLYSLKNTNTKKNTTYNENTPEEVINEIYLLNPKNKNNEDIVVRNEFNNVKNAKTRKNSKRVNSTQITTVRSRKSTKKISRLNIQPNSPNNSSFA
jgi:serine/threonine protein kinase